MLEEKIIKNLENGTISLETIKICNNRAIIKDNSSEIPHIYGSGDPFVLFTICNKKRNNEIDTYVNIMSKLSNKDYSNTYVHLKNNHFIPLKMYLANEKSFYEKLSNIDSIILKEKSSKSKIQNSRLINNIFSLKTASEFSK